MNPHPLHSWSRTKAGLALGLSACLVLAGAGLAVRRGQSAPELRSAPVTARFANQRPGVAYVGNEACANCHSRIDDTFSRHGMARTFGPIDVTKLAGDWSGRAVVVDSVHGYRYTPYRDGNRAFIRETLVDASGREHHSLRREARYVIGSGKNDQGYAEEVNGFLRVLPLEWYAESRRWDFAPMFERENRRFTRQINQRCIACHAGRPQFLSESATRLAEPLPAGVSCERCHGPGQLHVAARLAGLDVAGIDSTIVNPRHLSPARQIDICAQCHLQGDAEVLRAGRHELDFRPGEALDRHRAVFVSANAARDTADFGFVRQVERMVRSRCYTASGGALTCTTCHDPHVTSAGHPAKRWDDACLKCHAAGDCSRPAMTETGPHGESTAGCVACHMRRSEPYDVLHVTITDHWIRTRIAPPARAPATRYRPDATAPLARFELPAEHRPDTADDLELAAVAASELGLVAEARTSLIRAAGLGKPGASAVALPHPPVEDRELAGSVSVLRDPRALRVAADLLLAGRDSTAAHAAADRASADPECSPRVLLDLARTAARLGQVATARQLLERARAQDRNDPEILRALGELAALDQGKGAQSQAISWFTEALLLDPRDHGALAGKAHSLLASGDARAAASAFTELTAEEPLDSQSLAALGYAQSQLGELASAIATYERSLALAPNQPRVQFNYGNALAAHGDSLRAEAAFREATRLYPSYYQAFGNLGFLLLARGDSLGARQAFERVLAIAPHDPMAEQAIDRLQ